MSLNGPDPDDLQIGYAAMGDMLAAVPHRIGYRLEGSDQVAVQLSGSGQRSLITMDWDTTTPTLDAARQAARHIHALTANRPSNAVLLLGYGPEAAERIYALREALQNELAGADITIAAVQAEHDQWRAFGIGVTGDWHRMPEVPVSVLMDGYPAPAASLQDYHAQYQPLPQATFEPLPDSSRELIDATPPGIRVELATRALQRLADRTANPLDQAALAHVMNDPAINHAVVAHAYPDRARLGALIDTYRGAPQPQQPALASASATALWLHGRIREARQVNAAIPNHSYYATGRDHLDTLINNGIDPKAIADGYTKAADTHRQQADAAWTAHQTQPTEPTPEPTTELRPPPEPGVDGPGF